MFKKSFLVPLLIVLLGGMTTAFCEEPTKPIELRFSDFNPPNSGIAQITQKMADRMVANSKGRLKITYYPGESLLKMGETFRGVQSGVADISFSSTTMMGTPLYLNRVTTLPFLGITSMEMATAVHEKLFSQFPEVRAEYQGLKVLGFRGNPLSHGHFMKKEVRLPSDMKGMKIIAMQQWGDVIRNAGGSPVPLGIGDWYMSLERGLVEGHITHFPVFYIFKLLDLVKYHAMFGGGGNTLIDCFIINLDTWNRLPADLQKAIEDAIHWRTTEITKFDYGEEKKAIDYAKSKNHTFTYLTPEEIKLWEDVAKAAHEEWIKTANAKGLPGSKIYEGVKQIIKEYSK